MKRLAFAVCAVIAMPLAAMAEPKMDGKQPIEIASDNLEVLQADNKAIFTGDVIATQGDTTMRAAKMTVYYENTASPEGAEKRAAEPDAGADKGIKRIESEGDVVFITPEETAKGDKAIYNVKTDTIDLIGNVVLTREGNILKGATLNYNMTSGRSILNGGASSGGRVHGLFVPSEKK